MASPHASAEEVASWFAEYRRTGDRAVRNNLVEAHRHVADFYSKRYSQRGVPTEDLRQVALLAILRAVDRFDPGHGVEFSTFASRTIDGELKRYFRDQTWTVRPPRRAQELHLAVRRTTEDLTQRLGRSPTVNELAAELGETVDHVLEAMEAGVAHKGASLDQRAGGADGGEQSPALGERVLVHHEPRYGDVDLRLLVDELLAGLDERDRRIIEMRFFENRTQEEIAAELGMSQSYLSRVLRGLLLQLRDHLGDDPDVLAM